MNIAGTKTIDYIVHAVMASHREQNTNNYQYYLQFAIDGFQELNLYSLPQIKTVYLPIQDNHTVDFPFDYVNYVAIGVCINGHIWTLTRRDDMCLTRTPDCPLSLEEVSASDENIANGIPYWYFFSGAFRNGQYVGEQYALGGGWNNRGYYRVDTEKKRFEFRSVVPKTEIILEYKSSGISCDGTVEVPLPAVAAIRAYVQWQRIEHDDRVNSGEKERKRRQYIVEYEKLKHYNMMFTESEYLDAKYRHIKQTPKR